MSRQRIDRILDVSLVMACWCGVVYHMMMTQIYIMTTVQHQALHLCSVLIVVYLAQMRKINKMWIRAVLLLLILFSIVGTVYVNIFYEHLEEVIGFPETFDIIIGFILLIVVIVGSGIAFGPIFPIMTTTFIIYFFFGHFFPSPLYHNPIPITLGISYLNIGLSGLFGSLVGVMANFGLLFMVFGGLLGACGAPHFFMEIGKFAGRFLAGGSAQTAVAGSALVGTVSGAAVANVIITGSFTIPMMKKIGYKPEHAGAIEATASTGSQLMPPIMGSAAFMMAAFLDLPFVVIMLAALIPALLYFFGVAFNVQILAKKSGIYQKQESIDYDKVIKMCPIFLIPLTFLITSLSMYKSPGYGAFYSILLIPAVAFIRKSTRPTFSQISQGVVDGFVGGGKVAIAVGAVAILSQTIVTTGLAQKLATLIDMISFGLLPVTLFLTMLLCILLGCGLPPSGAYAIVAIMVAPALIQQGLPSLQVHFFVFYFAIVSAVTPPIALASMAASSIAKSNFWKTGLESFKLSFSGFLLPFVILFNPFIVWQPVDFVFGIISVFTLLIATALMGGMIYGYFLTDMNLSERVLTFLGLLPLYYFCIKASYFSLLVGFSILAFVIFSQYKKWRRSQNKKSIT